MTQRVKRRERRQRQEERRAEADRKNEEFWSTVYTELDRLEKVVDTIGASLKRSNG
mgnify:FL=1